MRTYYVLLCSVLFQISFSQNTYSGTVVDAISRVPVPYAAVIVSDSLAAAEVYIAEADESGRFLLKVAAGFDGGELTVRYTGYEVFTTKISKGMPVTELLVELIPAGNQLEQVVISAKRKAVSVRGDRIAFDVAALGVGDGHNGLETLRQIAGIRLDKDDNIQYRGNGDVQIMINGRKSLLQGDALREYIRSLKGSDIETVEIIAQPSARYEASGTAGIINIVLKKNRSKGISGNIYASAAYGEYFKNQNGGQLFYSDSLWNINGTAFYYDGNSVNHRVVNQNISLGPDVRRLEQYNEWLPETRSNSINLGVERKVGRRQLISTQWQYYHSDEHDDTYGRTDEFFNDEKTEAVRLTQDFSAPVRRLTGNLFYNYTADSSATKVDVQLNYAHLKNRQFGYQRNEYSNGSIMRLDGDNRTGYDIFNSQADLTKKLSGMFDLEVGVKYSAVRMRYQTQYAVSDATQLFIPADYLNNDFVYDEEVASGYLQLSAQVSNWNFLGGIRAEQYDYDAVSNTSGEANTGSYLNIFPSLSVSYKKSDNQYQFSYSRRIGRPAYRSLNPYYEFVDAYTVERGNPGLKPQMYHSFQLSYIYKSALSVGLYGYLYDNGFTSVIDYNESENYNITYQANASDGSRFGLSASLPYEQYDWWSMQLSADAAISYEQADIPGFSYRGSGFGYDLSLYQNFKLRNDWTLTWNGNYSGRGETPNGYTRPTYDFSISVKKLLLDKKLHLLGGCANILKKSLYSQVTTVGNVSTDWENRWETRRFYLQATYYFGGGNQKKVKGSSLREETDRTL